MKLRKRTAGILAGAVTAGTLALTAMPAMATSQVGSWWTGVQACSSLGVTVNQGHYQNYVSPQGAYFTRADGYNVKTSSPNWVRRVRIEQYFKSSSTVDAYREWTFTGTATASSIINVPTSIMPWIPADRPVGATMKVKTWTSLDATRYCVSSFTIGQG